METTRQIAAMRSLDGLSVGDAFGECFFTIAVNALSLDLHLSTRTLPNVRWRWTDDTAMAISIVEALFRTGRIDQDELAGAFASRYALDDRRGYGGTAHGILQAIHAGESWRDVSPRVLSGMGSMGNGGAMRAAPLGAFFADDVELVVEESRKSAAVTHAHPEGQAGAVAVALAAAFMASHCAGRASSVARREAFFQFILDHMPDSETRARISHAQSLPDAYAIETASSVLGNGSKLTAPDTVPFCLWSVARAFDDFEEAMWTTVAAGGDMDTNCAIVGGILAAGNDDFPPTDWLQRREPLPPIERY